MSSTLLPRLSPLSQSTSLPRSLAGRFTICLAASIFVALCAHISVPLPFTPVPATMQPFAMILVGLALGPAGGFAALTMYLVEGACGLPVFTPYGPGGVAQLLGPTAGYLFVYPVAAAIAGSSVRLFQRYAPAFVAAFAAGLLALLPVFFFGASWLAHVLGLTASQAIHLAVTPFLLAEALKLLAAAAAYSALLHKRA